MGGVARARLGAAALCVVAVLLALPTLAAGASPAISGDIPAVTPDASVGPIQCPSAGNCVAAGTAGAGASGDQTAFVLTESAGTWGPPGMVTGTVLAGATSISVAGLSCTGVGTCLLIGNASYGDVRTFAGFAAEESGGHWGAATTLPVPAAVTSSGDSWSVGEVACPATGDCVVAGDYETGTGDAAFVDAESAGTWGASRTPAAGLGTGFASPVALACGAVGDCVLAGEYSIPTNGFTEADHYYVELERGGAWGPLVSAPLPSRDADFLSIDAASCAGPTFCTVVGQYGVHHVLDVWAASEVSGRWLADKQIEDNLNLDHEADLTSVSCAAAGDCTAGGWYTSRRDRIEGLLVTESHDRWAPTHLLQPVTSSIIYAEVLSISCYAVGACAATGDEDSSAPGTLRSHGFAVRLAGGKVGHVALPLQSLGVLHTSGLASVTCSSDGSCLAGGYFDGSPTPFVEVDKAVLVAGRGATWSS